MFRKVPLSELRSERFDFSVGGGYHHHHENIESQISTD
jgi:hypothetical protein